MLINVLIGTYPTATLNIEDKHGFCCKDGGGVSGGIANTNNIVIELPA